MTVTAEWISRMNKRWMPYCTLCYCGETIRGRWGHCEACEAKREEYEARHSYP